MKPPPEYASRWIIRGLTAALFIAGFVVECFAAGKAQGSLPSSYKLLYEQNFNSRRALQEFVMTDVNAWRLGAQDRGYSLELADQSQYQPPVRSPVNIALVADHVFGDFILEADLQQTGKEYGHRDMCLFFGVQHPTRFYYVHLATAADKNAHNVFLVNDLPRTNIATKTTAGVNWGLGVWHKVRLERKGSSIKVFFDNLLEPVMVAEDHQFPGGFIGFGSFDDTGKIDNIRIWGPSRQLRRTAFFHRPGRSDDRSTGAQKRSQPSRHH